MGEWSDYFEDYPEENPANYDERGTYSPSAAVNSLARNPISLNQHSDGITDKNVHIKTRQKPKGNGG
jgi:hypothetical protein